MGTAWEQIAETSKLVVRPERHLELKTIVGIDLILLQNGKCLRFAQLKTQRNTLTGSQVKRSIAKLRKFPRPLFAAAFPVAKWTFPAIEKCGIERIDGEDFWNLIELDYAVVESETKKSLRKLELKLIL